MKELSLNILDIAENSIKAGSDKIEISIIEAGNRFELLISDNGCGMTEATVKAVTDPFYTTRTTRKVGLGIPLLKLAAEQTGGNISISSRHISEHPNDHGTTVKALFYKDHIDFIPLGDIVSTVTTLIQGSPNVDFIFRHCINNNSIVLDTSEVRSVLGNEVPLDNYDVIKWIADYLKEQYADLK